MHTRYPIFRVGNAGRMQVARRDDGQWFYRVRRPPFDHWSRWLACTHRPEGAWYDPGAGRAVLPPIDTSENKGYTARQLHAGNGND